MKQSKLLIALAAGSLVLSQGAVADSGGDNWSISGWINEGLTYYDSNDNSDIVQLSDNGTTLGSRITLAGSTELPNSSLTAGFEVILEPSSTGSVLGFGSTGSDSNLSGDDSGHDIGILGNSVYVSGTFGKITLGRHSTPTDNIAVLEDPSLTLWSSISPIFRGNNIRVLATGKNINNTYNPGAFVVLPAVGDTIPGTTATVTQPQLAAVETAIGATTFNAANLNTALTAIGIVDVTAAAHSSTAPAIEASSAQTDFTAAVMALTASQRRLAADPTAREGLRDAIGSSNNARFGSFLSCMGVEGLRDGLGIGIDCNGVYRNGIRYDLPAFGPVTVAIGHANDDVYDVAAKYKGNFAGLGGQLALGYSINQGSNASASAYNASETRTFQMQAGLIDPGTGIFGSFAYQRETAEEQSFSTIETALRTLTGGEFQDETDAWWLKVGIKKAFNSLGDTSFAFQYGKYSNQYGTALGQLGVTGSEVDRLGFEVNQYFGSRLIVYGVWENLEVSAECANNAFARATCTSIDAADDLNMFTTGMTFFF